FWKDKWHNEGVLKDVFPRLYALERHQNVNIHTKLIDYSLVNSFRRNPRSGVKEFQLDNLSRLVSTITLSSAVDRYVWSLENSGEFSVKSIRQVIDANCFPVIHSATRWVKSVPLKVTLDIILLIYTVEKMSGTVNWGASTVVRVFAHMLFGGMKEAFAFVAYQAELESLALKLEEENETLMKAKVPSCICFFNYNAFYSTNSNWETGMVPMKMKHVGKAFMVDQEAFGGIVGLPVMVAIGFNKAISMDRDYLERLVTHEEIKEAVWDCGRSKAPGPDRFSFAFVKKYWDIIKKDLHNFINSFFASCDMTYGANSTFFTLIPKVNNHTLITDFHPISLIGIHYKIIAKILANRLSKVIDEILLTLSAGITLIIFSIVSDLGLNDVLGSKHAFHLQEHLFLSMVALRLHNAFADAVGNGLISGININNSSINISHLFFADDVIITTGWNARDLENIIRVLHVFYLASGLKINIHKSNIYGIGVNEDEVYNMASNTGCIACNIPFNYLCLPIGSNMKSIANWKILIDRFRSRLLTWKASTDDEDAHEHVRRVLEIVDLFHFPGVTHNAIMLKDLLKKEVIWQYCSPFKTAKKFKEIRNFKQEMYETLYQALERYIDMLFKCPQHDLNNHQNVQIFYTRLDISTRKLLDSRGFITLMTPTQSLKSIQVMADYPHDWYDEAITRERINNIPDNVDTIQASFKGAHLTNECPLKKVDKAVEHVLKQTNQQPMFILLH
ncbi:hypothetical protein Tco_0696052, partial [Tanacetum coccineum]